MRMIWLLILALPLYVHADRYTELTQSFRCMVCDNQTIFDSHAPLAQSMCAVVAAKIKDGESDEQIKRYMQSRYGDAILYQPPFTPRTWALWLVPFFVMVSCISYIVKIRRQSDAGSD